MHRTLFDVGPFSVHLYGVMLAVAFWLGIELSIRLAKKRNLDPTCILDLGIIVLVSSVIGSRFFYVITHLTEYQQDVLGIFRVWEGGLSFYGGLAAGVIFGIAFLVRRRLPVALVTDIVSPQIALGIGIARIGCFLNGCCFGKESHLPWACKFPGDSLAGWVMAGKTIHPTQVYSAIANFLIFLLLRRLLRSGLARGTVFYSFLIAYGIWRFAIDFLRYQEDNMYVPGLGTSLTWTQVVSIGIAVTGGILIMRSKRRGEPGETP
jgi:phosphatidylglycerol:prolipoprotein diacylglycerol transferase